MGETRFHEIDMYHDDLAWQCEQCKQEWAWYDGSPKDNHINFCPNCGRKIIEFVYQED